MKSHQRELWQPSRRVSPGFSLLELTVVLAMALVATTIAVPTMINVMANAQLRQGMNNLSTLYQNGRTAAVRKNSITRLRYQLSNHRYVAWVDDGINPSGLTTGSAQVWLPDKISKVAAPSGSSPTPLTAAACGSTITPDTTDDTYFNQLGVPCQYSAGSCSNSQAFVQYFTYRGTLNMGTTWAALCVSPAGRIKAWYWDGNAWTN